MTEQVANPARTRAAGQTPVSRTAALAYFERWSLGDRANVRLALEHIEATSYYTIRSGMYVGVRNAEGKVVAYLNGGLVSFSGGASVPWALVNEDGTTWFPLTTYRMNRSGGLRLTRQSLTH